jgi:hypothetical protein
MAVTAPVLQAAQALRQLNGRIPEKQRKDFNMGICLGAAGRPVCLFVNRLEVPNPSSGFIYNHAGHLQYTPLFYNVNYRSGHHTPFNTFWSYSNFSQLI